MGVVNWNLFLARHRTQTTSSTFRILCPAFLLAEITASAKSGEATTDNQTNEIAVSASSLEEALTRIDMYQNKIFTQLEMVSVESNLTWIAVPLMTEPLLLPLDRRSRRDDS